MSASPMVEAVALVQKSSRQFVAPWKLGEFVLNVRNTAAIMGLTLRLLSRIDRLSR